MLKTSSKRVILMPSVKDNAKIVAAAKADPDAKPMTKAQLDAMVPIRAVRGRPKSENKKQLLSVRYSVEVVEYFRSTGEGWQARMDSVLRQYVNQPEEANIVEQRARDPFDVALRHDHRHNPAERGAHEHRIGNAQLVEQFQQVGGVDLRHIIVRVRIMFA